MLGMQGYPGGSALKNIFEGSFTEDAMGALKDIFEGRFKFADSEARKNVDRPTSADQGSIGNQLGRNF